LSPAQDLRAARPLNVNPTSFTDGTFVGFTGETLKGKSITQAGVNRAVSQKTLAAAGRFGIHYEKVKGNGRVAANCAA
jgi:hypothetical protein